MAKKEEVIGWIDRAIFLAKNLDRKDLLPVFSQLKIEASADSLPPVRNRASGFLYDQIYDQPLDGELGRLIETIYYFFRIAPTGYSWDWREQLTTQVSLPQSLQCLSAYKKKGMEIIEIGTSDDPASESEKADTEYDDSLFEIAEILQKLASGWYLIFDANSETDLTEAALVHANAKSIVDIAETDIRFAKIDFSDTELMWALVEQYEAEEGLLLFSFDQFPAQEMATWLLNLYRKVYDGDLEFSDLLNAESMARVLGVPYFENEALDLLRFTNSVALRFEYNSETFTVYRKH